MKISLLTGKALESFKGIDNITISKILKKLAPHRFYGVFSCDKIPISRLKHVALFCIVVNLSDQYQTDGHWITIIRKYNTALYIDSLGTSCMNIHILKMFVELNISFEENNVMIQSPYSSACGYFATRICILFEQGICVNKRNVWKYFKTNVFQIEENDWRCIEDIKRRLQEVKVKVKIICK